MGMDKDYRELGTFQKGRQVTQAIHGEMNLDKKKNV